MLDLLMQGRTNKNIARCLSISNFTVRDHVSSLLAKYGVEKRMVLIIVVGRMGEGAEGMYGPPTSVGLLV